MQLFMLTSTACRSMQLPDMPEGRFEIWDEPHKRVIAAVDGRKDGWYVTPVAPSVLTGAQEMALKHYHGVRLLAGAEAEKWILYTTPGSTGGRAFKRYPVPDNFTFTIGSAGDNELICSQPYMSEYHIVLEHRGHDWSVQCKDSRHGMFVNGKRCAKKALRPGDVVSVMEQKLIVLPGLIAFNSPDDKTALRTGSRLQELPAQHTSAADAFTSTPVEDFFHRAPRFSKGMDSQSLTVDSPPAPHEPSQTNALLTMAPSLLTGVVSLAITTNPLLPLASLAGATIFPFFNRKNAEKQQAEDEEKRKAAYKAYLDDIEKHIADVTAKQEEALRKRLPPTTERVAAMIADQHKLWNRNSAQSDYLDLRLGTGQIPLQYDITFPQDHFELQSDPMKQLMRELRERERKLENVPITLPLSRFSHLGIAGREKYRVAIAGNLLMQLAMDYGYDELKICLIGAMPELEEFSWLPHTWDNSRKNHLIARNSADMRRLLPILDGMLAGRQVTKEREKLIPDEGDAELVIFIFDPQIAHSGVVTRLLFDRKYRGVRVISFADRSHLLPRRSDAVISIHHDEARMIWQEDAGSESLAYLPEPSAMGNAQRLVSMLANTYLDLPDTSSRIPNSVPFLDLFGVQDVHSLNVTTRWKRNDPSRSMAAPIGIDEDGEICSLDIHENCDGPHGLIAGMTGSGKSETIMTYILSMAVSFSPEEVAFLLIDYKGGGMAKAFEDLPHTAGIITNLDGNAINRSLLAIQSELTRRQEIFHEAEQAQDLSNLNIIQYQRLYREGRVKVPLPHLLIITDEFAELKSQEPEFMQQLIKASRIGRSLGVNLILATQKPAGVVDDQIWSNTSWRVCLRVQDARDSQDVIKCPDAAALPGMGRFYVQIGYSMLRQAQSGFTGAPYLPDSNAATAHGVDVLDTVGHVLQHSELPRSGRKGKTESQLKAVVRYLQEVAQRQNVSCQPVWLPPLEEEISLESLRRKYGAQDKPYELTPVVGEIDDPATQSRRLLDFSLSEGKNALVYGGAGSGKDMFLHTVLEGLMLRHGPKELNIYILDYADEGLAAFKGAPQVGDVLSPQEEEKWQNLWRTLNRELQRRKKLLGGMGAMPLPERLTKANLPNILVVVHHAHVLREKMNDNLQPLISLMLDGPRFGVTFLGTTSSPGQIGFKMQEVFAQNFVLQMDQDNDYSMVLGRVGAFRPDEVKGRGILKQDGMYLYQTAKPDFDVEALCEKLCELYPGEGAAEVRVLPERVTAEIMKHALRPDAPWVIPVGMDARTLDPMMLDLKKRFIHPVLGKREDAAAFVGELLPLLLPTKSHITVWGSDEIGGKPIDGIRYVPTAQSVDFMKELYAEMAGVAEAQKAGRPLPEVTEKLIVMPAAVRVINQIKASGDDMIYKRMCNYLEKLKPSYRCTFVFCVSPGEIPAIQFETWYKLHLSNADGLFLGKGIANQFFLQMSKSAEAAKQEAAFPFGWRIVDGEGVKVKFLSDRFAGEEGGY